RAYSEEERVGVIEKMWEVVYADGVLDDYEANLLRRVAGLIYVPDRESGQARQRVIARLGITPR
ncbi:MAG: TerB family tellurite resistance protein, partial [Alphaproteobacteria bacterium HGW-Alphaproteobacteria-12]